MVWQEFFGFVGGLLITMGLIPQVWRLFKLRSAREISLSFTVLFLLGGAAWLSYGILLSLRPVILWNGISLAIMSVMIYAKLKYGR